MYSLMKLFLFLLLGAGVINEVIGSNQGFQRKTNPQLFVFGDSYADTGNMKHNAKSWDSPYGITYPGKPTGRYSDGLIATDYLEKLLGAKSPYLFRTHERTNGLKRGMNFAYGGSRVFENQVDRSPNMSAQVNFLVYLVQRGRVYNFSDVTPSDVAYLSYYGADYLDYVVNNPQALAYGAFVKFIMDEIKRNLWMLDSLKFKNIVIPSLPPIECLPHFTIAQSYERCNDKYGKFTVHHNDLLRQYVDKLNKEAKLLKKGQRFIIYDLHKAFKTILEKKGNTKFINPLKPCCRDCSRADFDGSKKYTICDDRKSAFFWDAVNPTQEGWKTIFSILGNPLK